MRIYRKGRVKKWTRFDKSGGTIKSRARDVSDLVQLRRRKLIETKGQKETFEVRLTKKGIIECLKMELVLTEILPDGLFCMVVFDIPESKSHLRKILRMFLKENCFISLQKSVWISQFNMVKIMEKLFLLWGIRQWVKIYVVNEDVDVALKNFTK